MNTTLKISLIAVLSATGLALRTVAIPISYSVQITPGMIMPILSGITLGLWPGCLTGLIIGIYAAVFSGEFWLIPLIGNLLLGVGAGIVTDLMKDKNNTAIKIIMLVISPSIIGGFIPTFSIMFILTPGTVIIALTSGVIDMVNALIAAIIAILAWGALKKIKVIEQILNPATPQP
ncbi:MAG: ECF transporter S component [Candidatus Odinarchaeota archaeon]